MIRLGFLVVLVGVATADVHAQAQPKPNVESATTQNEPQALPGGKGSRSIADAHPDAIPQQ